MPSPTAPTTITAEQAGQRLYEAFTHHFGPLDLGAHQPVVVAIAEYAQRCREGDEAAISLASTHVYEALTRHFGPMDLGAHDPLVVALAEYGRAQRDAGRHA